MNKLIEIKNIVKEFDGQRVLDGISLDIYENEFVTLLGPSGCGKTTLLRIIAGFLDADDGQVIFDGQDISGLPPYKREVNTVFQKYALFPHLNVYDNVAFGLNLKKEPKDIIEQKVSRMLRLVGLAGFEQRRINQMSGGQQQRVAIARALVNEPKVLLLDEPLGALDLKLRKDMQRELKKIQQEVGITFIFVTHDQEEALTMSDKIVVMKEGSIQQIGSPVDIYNEPINRYVANFIGESNIVDGVMPCDRRVIFDGHPFECVDAGFAPNEEVEVVIRPEDLDIVPPEQGKLRGTVKSVLFKGVHYETIVETRRGTSITVKMNVSTDQPVVNEEAGELIDADSFYLDAEDVEELTDAKIIARANAQAWKKDTEGGVSISKISYSIRPENGRYPVTFRTAAGTSITVDMIVEDANRVQSEEYQEEIYAVNFSKSVDDIKESMTLDNDLMVWADASAWSLAPEDDGARIRITDVIYTFDWETITPGVYDITFATQGMEYKVDTTDRTEPGDIVGLQFTPDDLHIMKKG
ncbi:spermidine/putrescine ABC transporter ATP-binding protein [Butyricicoccus porcorum]|uniref:Spermidine/putrescine import ATP-binding protein PotA n=1 Tax=Butyricicoccus porcorum TaxID=1945634 RepID=A0A252F866_9FIRM|nr:ABC transporter ATP-binding protein [Butyricicoccus porcorum]MDD6987846.1 ABC transporter ATP-binding protein [Butyricicoccus porcorum]MDY4483660.1 ABC transporter ATP-binding protein [Butyricicoccus porcorum]OUM21850.1 spermidine/putrescine ABC transporter ATP-binding protein [Butyricicoccus porcorum]